MSYTVTLRKQEIVSRLMEEAQLTEKPFGPYIAELFPQDTLGCYIAIVIP